MLIEVKDYDIKYQDLFNKEKELIKNILKDEVIDIFHIGSTSIKDLKSKPIIDIMPIVKNINEVDKYQDEFIKIGYEYMGEYGIKGRRYLRKEGYHLHIFDITSEYDIKRHLAFKMYLEEFPNVLEEYEKLKVTLANIYPNDLDGYCDGKDKFIKEAEAKALAYYKDKLTNYLNYTNINNQTIDTWSRDGWAWSKGITHDEYLEAINGEIKLKLTPNKYIPNSWLKTNLKDLNILVLAGGGGLQAPILKAKGANVTVIDISDNQLKVDRDISLREGYNINLIKYDITKGLPFNDKEFDIIISPVFNCYINDMDYIFRECYRVLKDNGIYIGGFDNGINYITNDELTITNKLPFNPLLDNKLLEESIKDNSGIQFSHTTGETISGLLKAKFKLIDIYEDTNLDGNLAKLNIPSFIVIKVVK